jgi:hypothetical protein
MIDPRSDEKRAAQQPPVKSKPRPRLTCPGHVWGDWMRDVLTVKTPFGRVYFSQPATHYRRFCRRCKAEQKGRGDAWARNVRPA